ncbi:putative Transcription factor [Quillaja saponaria]|uniref:Transcription factor n=1 Tax=Quillaja saponaria TaxID=32244 RepID=A0AAD7PEV1_QUISA|nr:putative Transcription factor [Quillaja saponaria]
MDTRFQNLGYSGNHSSNAFNVLGNPIQFEGSRAEFTTDTLLRLDSPGSYLSTSKEIKRKWELIDGCRPQRVGSSLSLGIGRSSSSSDSKGSSATACTAMSSAKETDDKSSMDLELDFTLHLGSEKVQSLKNLTTSNLKTMEFQPKVDLELSLSTWPSESGGNQGYSPPSKTFLSTGTSFLFSQAPEKFDCYPIAPVLSSSVLTMPNSSATCTSGITQPHQPHHRNSSSKTCQIEGCGKGARGASGCCISHGGGRRCQKSGCHKGAEGRTVYCKAHGGGRRCEYLGCTKSAEGRTDFCIAHGGGRRCSHEGCTRAARGKSGLCIRHGGGKRCQIENCTKSAEGLSGLCISHGGGRRCQTLECTKGAQGSTMFCKAHGGGKRCTAPGCTKGAEGSTPFCKGHGGGKRCAYQGGGICTKSVHGGTNFCVAHGGGKRCAVPDCTKSARGRTDYCVRHGGGKRCKFEGCEKSAQGSTDFCKAHGGGKRCSWGHPESEYGGQPGGPCNSFARGKTGLCALHSGLVQDKRVHGGVTLGPVVQVPKLSQSVELKQVLLAEDQNLDMTKMGISTGISDVKRHGVANTHVSAGDGGQLPASVAVPEGRVHGGSLMAMLVGSSGISSSSRRGLVSEPMTSYMMPHSWM